MPNFKSGDITLAVLLDGKKQDEFPEKQGHKYVGYGCTAEEAIVEWDKTNWQASISNIKKPTICTLKFETYKPLNGSEPVIKDELVPVVIADNGTVTKTEVDNDAWYDYNKSIWANAVILNGTDTYKAGEVIPEEIIESYFVWIPKYRYKLFNVGGSTIDPREIEIQIGDYDTVNSDTECKATNESGNNGTCANNKWMTHPAFTSLGVNGIWVGKFETGYKGSTDKASAQKNENSPEKVQIKPGVNSWRNISISNAYNTSFSYKRNLDSHMMKNTEWGAVAYLTNSKYGRGNSEVWINNNSNYVTGCAGASVSAEKYDGCENAWNTQGGYHASTTDNISGIYDTSGGAWDTVMGNLNNLGSLTGWTDEEVKNILDKYIDRYTTSNKILGDATGEISRWNGDYSDFVSSDRSWFYRGANSDRTVGAGVFSFSRDAGGTYSGHGFRLVISPAL